VIVLDPEQSGVHAATGDPKRVTPQIIHGHSLDGGAG